MSQALINSLVRRVDQLELALENAGLLEPASIPGKFPATGLPPVDLQRIQEAILATITETLRFNPHIYSDPVTIDIPGLSVADLTNKIHAVNSDLVRINALKQTLTSRLDELQRAGG
jgi:hypothetical protein